MIKSKEVFIQDYVSSCSEEEPLLLQELTRETHLRVLQPHMLSGHYQGRLLSMFSKMIRPQKILEIGTYTGYSTICLAEGLSPNGEIHTIEMKKELQDIQDKYFEKSGYRDNIIQYFGKALEIISSIPHTFDIVFIDADKNNYLKYFDILIDKVKKGGYIFSDNVLWKQKVLDEYFTDKTTKIIRTYNEKIQKDSRIETVMLPIRDGLTLSRVK